MNINEDKIKKAFDEAKEELKIISEAKKGMDFTYKTSGIYVKDGLNIKLKTAKEKMLVNLLTIVLNDFKSNEEAMLILDLSSEEKLKYGTSNGYSKEDWISDIKLRWDDISLKKKSIKAHEKIEKLKAILSKDQLRELEFEKIMKNN